MPPNNTRPGFIHHTVANLREAFDFLAATNLRFNIMPTCDVNRGMRGVSAWLQDPYPESMGIAPRPFLHIVLEWPLFEHELTPTVHTMTGAELEAWVASLPLGELNRRFFPGTTSTQTVQFVMYDPPNRTACVRQCPSDEASEWLRHFCHNPGWRRAWVREANMAFASLTAPEGTEGLYALLQPPLPPQTEVALAEPPAPGPPPAEGPSAYELL